MSYKFIEYEVVNRVARLTTNRPDYWRVGRSHEARFQWRRALSFKPEEDERGKIEAKLEQGLGEAKPVTAAGPGG